MDSSLRGTWENLSLEEEIGVLNPYHTSNKQGKIVWHVSLNNRIFKHQNRNFEIFEWMFKDDYTFSTYYKG